MQFFIGDEGDECDEARVVTEDCDEVPLHESSSGLTQILIDSKADTAVFPSSWLEAGVLAGRQSRRLQDAQGNVIPTKGRRDVEIFLPDVHGNRVCACVSVFTLEGELQTEAGNGL